MAKTKIPYWCNCIGIQAIAVAMQLELFRVYNHSV